LIDKIYFFEIFFIKFYLPPIELWITNISSPNNRRLTPKNLIYFFYLHFFLFFLNIIQIIIIFLFCIKKLFLLLTYFLKLFHFIYQKRISLINNFEEICNKIIVFVYFFYQSQIIVLKVASMIKIFLKIQTNLTLFLKF
jgi:hypothetical protein